MVKMGFLNSVFDGVGHGISWFEFETWNVLSDGEFL